MLVNSGAGTLADKIVTAVKKLSDKPIQFLVNTGFETDFTGGNVKLRTAGLDSSVQGSFFSGQFVDAGKGTELSATRMSRTISWRLRVRRKAGPATPSFKAAAVSFTMERRSKYFTCRMP